MCIDNNNNNNFSASDLTLKPIVSVCTDNDNDNFSASNLTLEPRVCTQAEQSLQGIQHRPLHSSYKPKLYSMPARSPVTKLEQKCPKRLLSTHTAHG